MQRRQPRVARQRVSEGGRPRRPYRVPAQVERPQRAVLVEAPREARRTLVSYAVEP